MRIRTLELLACLLLFVGSTVVVGQPVQPANDMFANAQLISGTSRDICLGLYCPPTSPFGSNELATTESGEPQSCEGCGTVWYEWTTPTSLSMTFWIMPTFSNMDTVLEVYKGTELGSLTRVAWNDDCAFARGTTVTWSRLTFAAEAGTNYFIRMYGKAGGAGNFQLYWHINRAESSRQFNFIGDPFGGWFFYGGSDFTIFRPSSGEWRVNSFLFAGEINLAQWGLSTDMLVPGDYDGDFMTEIAVWRPETGTFWLLADDGMRVQQWGMQGDEPVQGDFDGDDKSDFTVWRPSTGTFWVLRSSDGSYFAQQWGREGDTLACGDYDGDGSTDFAVRRNEDGHGYFWILRSSDGTWFAVPFGFDTDKIVPGDYDGDGKNDIAVYRESENSFYYLRSSDGGFRGLRWGQGGDYPVPGSYFGGPVSDVCVWRPTDRNLYCLPDGGVGGFEALNLGSTGDIPVAYSNVH